MKKLVFVFAMVVAMVASANVLKAQNYVNICGTVVGTNGVPVTVNFIDSLTGQTYSTVTDPSGNFCDSLSVQSSQGYMYAYITNCTGVTQWWGSYYNPGNLNFTVTFNYCNFLQSNLNVCVTVFNLPMNTVSVSIFANNTFHYLNFTGPGTVTLCDSFMVNGTSGTAVITMTDCNGNNISQTLQYSNGNMNLSANFNYCQVVQNFVTYCITMNNIPGGIAVPVYMYDSLAGIVDTLHFLGQGSYTICDTLTTPTFSGTLMFYYIDCNGQPQSYSFNYGPGNYSATFNWDYCPILTNCYAYWTSVYDSTNNTFYISVDTQTMMQAVTYFWTFGDNSSSILSNPTHTYNSLNLFNVCLTITTANGSTCTYCHTIGFDSLGNVYTRMSSGFNLVVLPQGPTGITENNSSHFELYPNPAKDVINITTASKTETVTVTLYNMKGEKVMEENHHHQSNIQLNIAGLKTGVYAAQIISGNSVETKRIIKQ